MIDETLTRLSRTLIAASDKLESEDFKTRQARYLEIEAERQSLAESLEADEAAVVAAQEALQRYVNPPAEVPMPMDAPTNWGAEKIFSGTLGETVDVEQYFRPVFGQTEPDEFSSSRANGAYTED
jgi:hypothetical protein